MGFNNGMPADQGGETIMYAHWPKPFDEEFKEFYGLDESDEQLAEARYELVRQGRNLRREYNIPSNKKVVFYFKPSNELVNIEAEVMRVLLNAEDFSIQSGYVPPIGTPAVHSPLGDLYMPLAGLIDIEAEKARLQKELEKARLDLQRICQKLENQAFVQNAPPAEVEKVKSRKIEFEEKIKKIESSLSVLGS
jgi:valyl-tRNA synthetase